MLLLEMTLYQLDRSTMNQFGPEREVRANRIQVNTVEFTSTKNQRGGIELHANAKVRGSTGSPYVSTIVFKHVKLESEDTPNNITIQTTGGESLHLEPGSLNSSDVQVRCSCLDFYWRFAMWNMKHRSLYGDPPDPYVKTTDRPPVNPQQKPGVCKHLYKMIQTLKGRGIMKNIDHGSKTDAQRWGQDRMDAAKKMQNQEQNAQQQQPQQPGQPEAPDAGIPPKK